jgi:hypothetical protein
VLQDVIVLGLLELTMAAATLNMRLAIPLVFLAVHSAIVSIATWWTGQRALCYGLWFALGGVVAIQWFSVPVALALAILVAAVAYFGLLQSFAGFPWREQLAGVRNRTEAWNQLRGLRDQTARGDAPIRSQELGWPFAVLGPESDDELPRADLAIICIIVGWWFAAVDLGLELEGALGLGTFAIGVGASVAGLRMYYCLKNHRSPIGLWGRVFTFRWLIPYYDAAFIAPIAWLVAGTLLLLLGVVRFLPMSLAIGLAVSLSLLGSLVFSPRLHRWCLTAPARVVPFFDKGSVEEL